MLVGLHALEMLLPSENQHVQLASFEQKNSHPKILQSRGFFCGCALGGVCSPIATVSFAMPS